MHRTISSVISLHDRKLTAPNINIQLNQCREKNLSASTMIRRLSGAGLYGRTAVKNPQLRKQNHVKILSGPRRTKTAQQSSEIKSFGSKSLGQIERRFDERAYFRPLVERLPRMRKAVIGAKGGHFHEKFIFHFSFNLYLILFRKTCI